MIPTKNLPLLMNLAYYGVNRGLEGDFKPVKNSDGVIAKTFCNEFIQYVCNGFGYDKLNGMMANDIISYIERYDTGWITVGDEVAQSHANNGVIVIAGHKGIIHGHVCLIVPGLLEKSGSYGKSVPKCANVGGNVFLGKRVSFAFQGNEMPRYFCLAGQI